MKRELLVYLTALEISFGIFLVVALWVAKKSAKSVLGWIDGYLHRE